MVRTAADTACLLRGLYDEDFSGEENEPYLIGWDQLRGIAGVERLTDDVISEIGKLLLDYGFALVPFDNFLLVTIESSCRRTRKVPARLVETYLAVSVEELVEDDGDQELGGGDDN